MNVSEIMTEEPVSIKEGDFVTHARQLMRDYFFRGIVVVDEGNRLVGMLNDQDIMFRKYDQKQQFLLPLNLEDFVPENHLARVLNDIVDVVDITAIESTYSKEGCPAYHPIILLKILLYGYLIGIRSSRKLQQMTQTDTAFMYLAAMIEKSRQRNQECLERSGLLENPKYMERSAVLKNPEYRKSRIKN